MYLMKKRSFRNTFTLYRYHITLVGFAVWTVSLPRTFPGPIPTPRGPHVSDGADFREPDPRDIWAHGHALG
jgi:hypothetical protein